jgi:hypothetical protein
LAAQVSARPGETFALSGDVVAAGYDILTRSPDMGVDMFAKRQRSLFVLLQGHPEYDPTTLLREYRRDVGRFLRREHEGRRGRGGDQQARRRPGLAGEIAPEPDHRRKERACQPLDETLTSTPTSGDSKVRTTASL